MITVGVTGGIGSGKSRVGKTLAGILNCAFIDVDRLCRLLLEPGEPGHQALARRFGSRFFMPDGCLDRAALRRAIFASSDLRTEVDGLIHPLARQRLRARLSKVSGPVAVLEIPLLIEAGWQQEVDRVVVVWSARPVRCRRIVTRDRVSGHEAVRAMDAQMDLAAKVMAADHVIDNSGPWSCTYLEILHLADLVGGNPGSDRKKCLTARTEVNI